MIHSPLGLAFARLIAQSRKTQNLPASVCRQSSKSAQWHVTPRASHAALSASRPAASSADPSSPAGMCHAVKYSDRSAGNAPASRVRPRLSKSSGLRAADRWRNRQPISGHLGSSRGSSRRAPAAQLAAAGERRELGWISLSSRWSTRRVRSRPPRRSALARAAPPHRRAAPPGTRDDRRPSERRVVLTHRTTRQDTQPNTLSLDNH